MSLLLSGVAALSLAAVVVTALRHERRPIARPLLPPAGPTALTPSYQMLRAAAAAGVLRN